MPAQERPAPLTVEDLLAATTLKAESARQRHGRPHPLSRFALKGGVVEGPHAGALLDALVFVNPSSPFSHSANWFLLESEMFFEFCAAARVDARKWRRHLRRLSHLIHHNRRIR